MGRLLAIDYGRKRCGIAVTDPLQIVANPLQTVRACDLCDFIAGYIAAEPVEAVVVGLPKRLDGTPSESQQWLRPAMTHLQRRLPDLKIIYYDERFTSTLAHRAMIDGGMKKKDRQDKATVDMISAAIILNDYLQSRNYAQS